MQIQFNLICEMKMTEEKWIENGNWQITLQSSEQHF